MIVAARMHAFVGASLAAVVFVGGIASSVRAAPLSKEECNGVYEEGHKLAVAGKPKAAREKFIQCAQTSCPDAIAHECAALQEKAETSLASLVFVARTDDGASLFDVEVEVDGEVVAHELDGKAYPVDPGKHAVRFRHGGRVVDREVLVAEGAKLTAVEVVFAAPKTIAPMTPVAPPKNDVATSSSLPASFWIALGVGVVGVAGTTIFGLEALHAHSDLHDRCPSTGTTACSDADVSSMRTKSHLATASLGVAVLGFGAATVLFFTSRSSSSSSTSIGDGVGPVIVAGGGGVQWVGTF